MSQASGSVHRYQPRFAGQRFFQADIGTAQSGRPMVCTFHTFQPRAKAGDHATSSCRYEEKVVRFHHRPYRKGVVLNRSAALAKVSALCAFLSSSSCSRPGTSNFAAARASSANLSSRSSRDNVRRFRLRRLDMQLLHSPSCPQHLRWRGSWCLSADAPCCHCRRPLSGW